MELISNPKKINMRKATLVLAMVFTLLSTVASANENVRPDVLNSFKNEFSSATEVSWTIGDSFYQAAFTMNNQKLFAFYNTDGEFIALTRYISSTQLPLNLHNNLKKYFSDQWVTNLFEVVNSEGTLYYATLEDANSKIVLTTSANSTWSVFRKIEKK